MGGPKHKWTAEEKEALRAGVAKYGTGKWKFILKDPEFLHSLSARTNVDLKDKWRNMCVSASGWGSRDQFKSPELKALPTLPVANSNASSSLSAAEDATTDVAMDPSKSSRDQFKSPDLKALPALPALPVANSNASSSHPAAEDATTDVAMDPLKSSRDQFKSPELKALPALPALPVANSNASSSLPAAEDATRDVAIDPSKSPVDRKWGNMCVSASGRGSRDKFKSPKLKAFPAPLAANSNAASSLPVAQDATTDVATNPSKSSVDVKPAPRYNALIFEAISTSKDLNGSDISAIISFIEQRTEVPHNFRKVLSSKLRRFVNQGKLEKVQNRYRIQKTGASGQKIPTTPKPRDDQHVKQSQTPPARTRDDKREEAKKHTAYLIADTENKSFLASEAVQEAERFAKMVEDAEALHLFAKEILERTTRGEDVTVA